jgi:hypothetical protein
MGAQHKYYDNARAVDRIIRVVLSVSKGTEVQVFSAPAGHLADASLQYVPPKWEGFILPNIVDEPDYSLLEIDTGVKWIDGKTIYQKVVPFSITASTSGAVDNELIGSGVDTLISGTGQALNTANGSQYYIPKPSVVATQNLEIIRRPTGNIIMLIQWATADLFTGHATLKYTKV